MIAYHLNRSWLPGGYLGVDLFFVLSGYLITSLLIAEHGRTGRIDLPAFWLRRFRRLLPAVLIVVVAIAVIVQLRGDVLAEGAARGDLLATLFYVANWHFISSGQSYFSQYLAVSPVRHTWSLSVEEQFYLLWPLVAAFVLARFPRHVLAAVAGGVAIASALLMAFLFDPRDPSRAYYGSDTRIFEILIGALAAMALAGPFRERLASMARKAAWPALLILTAGFVFLADDNALYYLGGAVGLAVAAAILIVGLETGGGPTRFLSRRPLVLVGLASYGLYLWHFPIITFINQGLGPTSFPPLAALAVVLTLGAALISYVLVETPIRRRGTIIRFRLTPRRLVWVVPIASGLVALIVLAATASGIPAPDWTTGTVVGKGVDASSVPATVTLTTPPPGASPPASTSGAPPSPSATSGRAIHTIGVVGDSVIASALPGLEAEASARGWTIVAAAAPGCPIAPQPLFDNAGNPSSFNDGCQRVPALHAQLIGLRPDLIIWEDLQSVLARRAPDGTLLRAGSAAWTTSLVGAWTVELDRFLAAGARVVIVMPPERSQQAQGCLNVPLESRCIDLQRQDAIIRAATATFWASLADRTAVRLVSVDQLVCPTGVPCPAKIDGIAVRLSGYDQTHFTAAGATWFAPRLLDLIVDARARPANWTRRG